MKQLRSLQSFFLNLDQFGQPVSLKIGNNTLYNTMLGSFFTSVLIFISARSLYELSFDLFNKGNPQVILSEEYMLSPGKFQVKHDEFDLAYLLFDKQGNIIDDPDHFIMKPAFGFVSYELYSYDFPVNISFIPCQQLENYQELVNKSVGLIKDIFSNGICLNKTQWRENENLSYFQGGYADYNLTAMYFYFEECKNQTQGIKILYLKDAYRKLTEAGQMMLMFIQPTLMYQSINKIKIVPLIRTINYLVQKTRTIFMNKIYFIDIINPFYFFSQIIEYEAFKIATFQAESDLQQTFLLVFGWQLDNVKKTYQRTYPTILSVLGQLGGLYSSLFYIFNMFLKPYVKQSSNLYLLKQIYTNERFSLDHQNQINSKINSAQTRGELKELFRSDSQFKFKDMITYLCGSNHSNGYYDRATKEINKCLNIVKLIKQYHKQKIILGLILNKDQREIFKIRQKPTISRDESDEKFDFFRIVSSYKVLIKEDDRLNQQLIKLVDQRIKQYLFNRADIGINSIEMDIIQYPQLKNTDQVQSPRQEEDKLVIDQRNRFDV